MAETYVIMIHARHLQPQISIHWIWYRACGAKILVPSGLDIVFQDCGTRILVPRLGEVSKLADVSLFDILAKFVASFLFHHYKGAATPCSFGGWEW